MNNKSTKNQSRNQALEVLIIGAPTPQADPILRELHRAKYDVTPHYVNSIELLNSALVEGQFDIVLFEAMQSALSPDEALQTLRASGIDIPCIVVAEEIDVETAVGLMRQGAGDCIARHDLQRLAPAVEREMREAAVRRNIARERNTIEAEESAEQNARQGTSGASGIQGVQGHNVTSTDVAGTNVASADVVDELRASQEAMPLIMEAHPAAPQPAPGTMKFVPEQDTAEPASQGAQGSHEAPAALASLVQAISAQSDPAAIVHALSVHLKPLLPFDSVGVSLLAGGRLRHGGRLHHMNRSQAHESSTQNINNATNETSRSESAAVSSPVGNEHDSATITMWASGGAASGGAASGGAASGAAASDVPQAAVRWSLEVPLQARGHALGTLHFVASRVAAFSPEQEQLAHAIAAHVALAMQQSQRLRQAHELEEKYRLLFSNLDVIVWEVDPVTLRFTFVNARAKQWFGYPVERWTQEDDFWSVLVHPDDRERVLETLRRLACEGGDSCLEYQVVTASGDVLHLRNLINAEVQDEQATRMDGMMLDITEQKHSEAALLQSNAVLKATQEAAADGIFLVDDHGQVVSFNQRFIEMWRVPRDMIDSLQEKQQLMAFVLSNLKDPDEFIDKLSFVYDHPHATTHDEIYLNDGRVFSRHAAPALSPEGKTYGWVWSFSDITEAKRYELELARQASHDSLTNLPNRLLFMDRLKRALSRSSYGKQHMMALLFVDLDRFKVINDSLGHEQGDRMLIELAQRLRACIRPGDTAARFGGDEFTILLEDISSVNEATRVAERVEDYLQTPFALGGHEIFSTASIGIVISTGAEDRAEVLLRHADVAMYRAKSRGGGQYEVFDSKMNSQALDRLQLEIDLRQALRRKQMRVYYQPQVEARSGQITGFEALLRWYHPLRGIISPVEFIPISEETGMIFSLGHWVLREACQQARKWQTEVPRTPPLEISVNLSAKQFQQPGLADDVARVLKETQLDPRTLMLEITESTVMEDEVQTMSQLEALKKLGVQLAIDDFGTGYSSLSYLERFAINTLKIDRTFVNRIGERGENTAIVRAVSTLGQGLGVHVTAEGVETAAQMTQLRALGCHTGQGYFFAKPLPADEATDLLIKDPTW
ncbi:MAG TPA: EAL domain-containing protein [Abditibacteriaceae bacterium]